MPAFRVVIAGGGVAGLEAVLALRSLGGDRVAPVLVSPDREFSMRAHDVAAPFAGPRVASLPLAEILFGLDVARVEGILGEVRVEAQEVRVVGGDVLAYDGLLLAIGGVPFPAYAHGVTFDRPGDPAAFDELLSDVLVGLVDDVAFVAPDARGWTLPAYELAFLLRGWARRNDREIGICVVTAENAPLQLFGAPAAAVVRAALDRAEIDVLAGSSAVLFSDTAMVAGGRWVTAGRIVSLPRLSGPRLAGVPCDANGFVLVESDGAIPGCGPAFAVGDGAAHAQKQGGLAAQQADRAARCLLRQAGITVAEPAAAPALRGVLATLDGPLFLQSTGVWGQPGAESLASFEALWDPPTKVATRWLGPRLDTLMRRRFAAFAA